MAGFKKSDTENGIKGRQSLDRGLAIMQLLAQNGPMTSSAIGEALGVNQSSASRLLQSLIKCGFVRKPSFHSFALDYGILLFAGIAMERFPVVPSAIRVCEQVHNETGYGTAVGMLHDGHLLYLARIPERPRASIGLIRNTGAPSHESAIVLSFWYQEGIEAMMGHLAESLEGQNVKAKEALAERSTICQQVVRSISSLGFLHMKDYDGCRTISVKNFDVRTSRFALCLSSLEDDIDSDKAGQILHSAIDEIQGEVSSFATKSY